MFQLGLPVSSMLGGLFSRGVDSAPHSRERAGNWDAPGLLNKTPPGLLLVGGTRCFEQAMD